MNTNTPKLFDPQPRITIADRKRLEPVLTGWNRVMNWLKTCPTNDDDLMKLIIIEVERKKRKPIIQRLVGRLLSNRRKALMSAIDNA